MSYSLRQNTWNIQRLHLFLCLDFVLNKTKWTNYEVCQCLSIYQLNFLDTGLPRGNVHERDSDPMRGVPSLPNPTTRKGWPHHRGLRPLLFSNSSVGSFTSHKNRSVKVLWDGTYGFSSLSEKTIESLTICRCHYKGSSFFSVISRPRVLVQPWFEPLKLPLGRLALSQLS